MIKLRYPVITIPKSRGEYSTQPVEPIVQIQSYMHQLVDDLNYALATVEATAGDAKALAMGQGATGSADGDNAQASFNAIKALIIKSADIVNAYYTKISAMLEGKYVAQSDFGTFVEETNQKLEATSTAIEQVYSNMQEVLTDIENLEHSLIEVNAHIKSGLLYYDEDGVPVYGLEIGQRSEIDGVEVFNKYARFTSEKLSFYDSNDNEVAYISDKKLYIMHIEVTGSFSIGGFVDTPLADRSVVTRWVEGSV